MAKTQVDTHPIRFYFSFRSPYAWLALHRLGPALRGLPVAIEYIPVYPPKEFPNDPAAVPAKLAYIARDAARTAEAYGLTVRFPESLDTDWARPHAAFLYADSEGCGPAFAVEVFAARFSRGLDVGEDQTLADAALACGLDPTSTLKAAASPETQQRVMAGIARGLTEDGLFGVPTFAYRGETFWGNDRIEWLVRAIQRDAGMAVPNLGSDITASPHLAQTPAA
jgi:2-hydroxychromene-2-carboxylate isomerase